MSLAAHALNFGNGLFFGEFALLLNTLPNLLGFEFGYSVGDTGVVTSIGLSSITVRLYEDSNGNGVIDAADALIATTATDSRSSTP